MRELREFLHRYGFKNATSYAEHELVVVSYKFRGRISYFRALITDEVSVEDDESPQVNCFLIDIGVTFTTTFFNVGPLPKFFCHKAPMVRTQNLLFYSEKILLYNNFEYVMETKSMLVFFFQYNFYNLYSDFRLT